MKCKKCVKFSASTSNLTASFKDSRNSKPAKTFDRPKISVFDKFKLLFIDFCYRSYYQLIQTQSNKLKRFI